MIKIIVKKLIQNNARFFYKKSYSQCGEDMIINHIFLSRNIKKPSFLDIGAHHPWYLNNTAFFYKNGSNGINIEPDPRLFNKFKKQRCKDINLNIGISDEAKEMTFFLMSNSTLNTFLEENAIIYENEGNYKIIDKINIRTDTIESIIKEYSNGKYPDLLNIDVEGYGTQIIKNINYDNDPPKVICIETISFSNDGYGIKDEELINYICSKGYSRFADTNINTIFVLSNIWQR